MVIGRLRRLPLFWKLLLPFATLIMIVGSFGAFLITRDLATRARNTLNQDLLRASLEGRALLQHRELYLLDSANLAANLQGMADSVRDRDTATAHGLLRSVAALKTDLDVVVVASRRGVLAGYGRVGEKLRLGAPPDLDTAALARRVLDEPRKHGALAHGRRNSYMLVAAPICSTSPCDPVGVAIVALRVDTLVRELGQATSQRRSSGMTWSIYGTGGALLASSGSAAPPRIAERPVGSEVIRRSGEADGADVHTLYAPLEIEARPVGVIAVTLPVDPVFASVRGAGVRLALVLLVVLLGIIALGALLSRQILRQVRPLVEANRALGRGDLSVRVPVVSGDEIGEVARGLNVMAEQLQASHENLESRVMQRTEEVQRLLEQRTEFFASLSHELRTPLAIILNEADALLEDEAKNSSARMIKMSGAHLLGLVNDILELAKAEVGRLDVSLETTRLQDVLAELRPTIEGLARASSVDVSIGVPKTIPLVLADRRRIREVILNLVDNAVKYTPSEGAIEVTARAEAGDVVITVSDTGPGIPPDAAPHIFEPFYRAKGVEPRDGRASTGLGLALTKRLVEAHGGRIWFETRDPHGTSFRVALPVTTTSPPAPRHRSARAGAAVSARTAARKR